MNVLIRKAINNVVDRFQGPEIDWLKARNPAAFKQLGDLMDKVDKSALAGDVQLAKAAIKAWESTWLFWIQSYRMQV